MLDQLEKPLDRAALITICGDAGTGKTTTAATFPNPVFIRAEDGLQSIPVEKRPVAFPVLKTAEHIFGQLTALMKEQHEFKTVVIDSITALERLFIQHVIDSDPKQPRSINQALGGYGAGLSAVATMHQRLRKACGELNQRKGMHVVFIAHADTETVEPPDQDAYTRYSLRLGKKSMAPYVDDVDVVGFLKLKTALIGEDKKQAVSDGSIVMIAYATAANISKNRYGITKELPVQQGANPLTKYIPSLKTGE